MLVVCAEDNVCVYLIWSLLRIGIEFGHGDYSFQASGVCLALML